MTYERIKQLHAIFAERYSEKCKKYTYLEATPQNLLRIRDEVSGYITEMFHTGVFNSYLEYRKFLAFVDPIYIDEILFIFHKN